MPKYVVISNHPPNSCPSGNKTLKEIGRSFGKDVPAQLESKNIKAETILHLDPGHKVLWLLDAPTAESVRDFVYDAGLVRWNDFEFYMASSMEEITKKIDKLENIW